MLRNLIILPDGTELFSGTVGKDSVMSSTLTECVNNGEELILGSTCANMLEATLWNPGGRLSLNTGDELTLFKVDDTGTRHKVGIFVLERPTRTSANTLKITGYDRVTKLDKDLTRWLNELTGWPYTLLEFAGMVCDVCGVTLATDTIPNADFPVRQYTKSGTTGRQLMQWIGEVCARFCRANADGEIEFVWYTPSDASGAPTGDNFYFSKGLTYEAYKTAPIEAVQLRLADNADGYLWPEKEEGLNTYVITGNPFLSARINDDLKPYLEVIESELAGLSYTPCKVSCPARLDIRAGNTFEVTDSNGVTFTALCMTKTTKGQKDTIECTGSARRDSSMALNNSSDDTPVEQKLTQQEIFEILTNGGEIEGLFLKDGQLYINASYIVSGKLASVDGSTYFDLDGGRICTENEQEKTAISGGYLAMYYGDDMRYHMRVHEDCTFITVFNQNNPLYIHAIGGLRIGTSDLRWGDVQAYWGDHGDGTYTLMGRKVTS